MVMEVQISYNILVFHLQESGNRDSNRNALRHIVDGWVAFVFSGTDAAASDVFNLD